VGRSQNSNPYPPMRTLEDNLAIEPPAAILLGRKIISVDAERGAVVMQFQAQPEFLNRHGTVQGGLLAAMLDSTTAMALFTVLSPELTAVTSNLNVSFLKPAKQGSLTATGRLLSNDGRNAQCEGELRNEDGLLVATATATLRILQRLPPP
jgi:uncharacterized protein (TIGR00369 family)